MTYAVRTVAQTFLFRKVFPLLVSATMVAVVVASDIPPTAGWVAIFATIIYAVVMFGFAVLGPQSARVHGMAAALAVLVTAGRAGGFLEIVLDMQRWDLIPATMERFVIMTALLLWHQAAAFDHARRIHLESG